MPPGSQLNSDSSDLESVLSLQVKISRRRSSTGPKYYCGYGGCNEVFKRLDHLDRHEFHHSGVRKHACTYEGCEKSYTIVTHLKRHLRTTHERSTPAHKTVPCEVEGCDKLFLSSCNMQRHVREVHENPKVYCCAHCGEKFTQKLKMRRHEINKHTHEFPYNCSKCGKGFYQEWQHERHESSCKIYPCPSCELYFEKWSLYLKHCKETQHGRKYYKCPHCERTYGKPSDLQKHTAAKHMVGEQMYYRCTHEGCERFYAYERNLRQHIATAHAGKRFECKIDDCGRVFRSAQNLSKHLKREHCSRKRTANEVWEHKKNASTRKKRKDAGEMKVSHLVTMSGLAVNKEFDKLLRVREANALGEVVEALAEAELTPTDKNSFEVELNLRGTHPNVIERLKENELESLLQMALESEQE